MMGTDNRIQILDCLISRTDMPGAVRTVVERVSQRTGGYVCFSNVHTVVTSCKDSRLRDITNQSFMSMPDGKPLSIVAKMRGAKDISQVAGPDFMLEMMDKYRTLRHYFYGSTEETLALLSENLNARFPGVNIVGTFSPPFRPLDAQEADRITAEINQSKPDIVWVGLGAPKQEYWMAQHWGSLRPAVLLGVGAAFDFHAGQLARAPQWVRRFGLEWLHRLLSEPRRLWRRYLVTNSLFTIYLVAGVVRTWVRGSGSVSFASARLDKSEPKKPSLQENKAQRHSK